MNNFELHEQATQLSDTHSGYELARMLLQTQKELRTLKGNRVICDGSRAHQLSLIVKDLKFITHLKDNDVTYNILTSLTDTLEKEIDMLNYDCDRYSKEYINGN